MSESWAFFQHHIVSSGVTAIDLSQLRGNLIDMKNRHFRVSADSYLNLNKIKINFIHLRKQEYLVLKCRNGAGESNDFNNNCRNVQYEF